jgi:hypothetical protein
MGEGEALGHCELCFVGASAEEAAACEMPVPHDVEAMLLDQIPEKGETVVAFALLRQADRSVGARPNKSH